MRNASTILFNAGFEGRELFKNQLDLVQCLLRTPNTDYYSDPKDPDEYARQQIRLKTLVSQLLSPHVARNIPAGFEKALEKVIAERIGNEDEAGTIVSEVLNDLKKKNADAGKVEARRPFELLKADFKKGHYIAIITSAPLEIEAEPRSEGFSIRELFVSEFLESIETFGTVLKKYRLLFPVKSSCTLFWKGMKQITYKHLKKHRNETSLISTILQRLESSANFQHDLFNEVPLSDEELYNLSVRLLKNINKEGYIKVFLHETPLFTLPVVAIDPAEFRSARIYTILSTEKENAFAHRYAPEEVILWRHFVWDRLKMKPFSGEHIAFEDTLDNDMD